MQCEANRYKKTITYERIFSLGHRIRKNKSYEKQTKS